MYVASLSVVDFRSYPAAEVELEPGVTTFVGANGEGKTNLVEAVGYLAHLGSHRVANDAPLVRRGADAAIVRAEIVADGRSTRLELAINPGRANRGKVGGSPVTRQRDLLGHLRTVLFAPEDLTLVKGEPADRRAFLDDLLVARAPRFAGVRADYERVVRQRNALLRSAAAARRGGADDELLHTLEVWDAQLVTHGAELLAGRVHLVNLIDPLVGEAYLKVSDDDGGAGVAYTSALGTGLTTDRRQLAQALTEALAQRRREELDRGVTLVGPHRDDLAIRLGEGPAKGYASHGESWSLALALRLASYELLRADAAHGQTPVLILDDVFAELDSNRRERLAVLVAGAEQVLVTAAVGADVPEILHGERWTVTAGTVRRG